MADRILIVEQEEVLRETISSILTTAGYQSRTAADGLEALAVLNSGEEFGIMFSSIMMPNLDGIGLLERTKNEYPDMSVVFVTAVHDVSVALACIRNGAYDYLLKPFEREQLLNAVSRALENRRLKLENRTYQTSLESLVKARTNQLQDAMSNLARSYDITVEGFGDALAVKNAGTEGHSKRVTAFAIAIARAMCLPGEQIAVIARGAFLHDIGKMATPEAILCKPDKLNPEEVAIMRQHPYVGYQMLKKIPFLSEAAEIVYAHHENLDGTGYPRGLKGNAIPLGARIVAVANTLDSITSNLPYRSARSLVVAKAEMEKWAGRQLDPEIVRTFLTIRGDMWEDLRKDIDAQICRVSGS